MVKISQAVKTDMPALSRDFFARPTLDVAQDLLGKRIVFNGQSAFITETEAYIGKDDPACHAARGKTKRNAPMFGPPGFSYVYLIYGMHYCLNFVTEREGFAAAVLIRAACREVNGRMEYWVSGPGKLCRDLGITAQHSNVDLVDNTDFFVAETPWRPTFKVTPRIGISKGKDKPWRFVVENPKYY